MSVPGPLPSPVPVGRRTRSLLVLLPLAGVAALLPPAVLLFDHSVEVLGVPLRVVYPFAAWLALVAAAAVLATRFRERRR